VTALTRPQSLALADRFSAASAQAADPDTAGTLYDLAGDLVNHANGHPVPWLAGRGEAVAGSPRGLKTGDLVRLPGRTAVVESVSLDGLRFTDTAGAVRKVADAEPVPLPADGPVVSAAEEAAGLGPPDPAAARAAEALPRRARRDAR